MTTYQDVQIPPTIEKIYSGQEESKILTSTFIHGLMKCIGASAFLFALIFAVYGFTKKITNLSSTASRVEETSLVSSNFDVSNSIAKPTTSGAEDESEKSKQCRDNDVAVIYKYTIAASKAVEDATWSEKMMGCHFRNVTESAAGCSAKIGKTSCMASEEGLSFGLHFVWNSNSEEGPMNVGAWDEYFIDLHQRSFSANKYNQFMDYSLTMYAPDLSDTMNYTMLSGGKILARYQIVDDVTWYYFYMTSPSGKVFELTSTRLNEELKEMLNIQSWDNHSDSECPMSHIYSSYSVEELDERYALYGGYDNITKLGLPLLMPIRTNIAVPIEMHDSVVDWYHNMMPAIGKNLQSETQNSCKVSTARVGFELQQDFMHDIRFVSNPTAWHGKYAVKDFVDYIMDVEKEYTGVDWGWTSWYDRHLGIELLNCPLDEYMKKFAANNVSFMPHGRNITNEFNATTEHCWTQGTAAYGLEMQGSYNFEYHKCYQSFDWCSWDTQPAKGEGLDCA